MEQSAYLSVLKHLNQVNKPMSPHELGTVLGKSRVTIHAALRRLVKTGWVAKEGASPKVFYRAVDPFAPNGGVTHETPSNLDPHSVVAFIAWCKQNRFHVPEIALEYQKLHQPAPDQSGGLAGVKQGK